MTQALSLLILLALAVGVVYVLMKPQWTIVLVVLMFPLEQLLQSYLPFFAERSTLINLAVGCLGAFALMTAVFRGQDIFRRSLNPAAVAIYAVYGFIAVGMLWTPSRDLASSFLQKGWPYFGLLLVIAPMLVRDLDALEGILIPIMLIGTVVAILILVNPSNDLSAGRMFVATGAASASGRGNPLALGTLGGTLALIAALIRPRRASNFVNLIRIAAFISGLGLAINSGSRGQVGGVMIVGLMFFPLARRLANPRQFLITALGFAALIGGFVLAAKLFIGASNQGRWDLVGMMEGILGRFHMLLPLVREYISSPAYWLFGLGTNAYTSLSSGGTDAPYVHNIPVEILCENGIIAFGLFAFALIFTWRQWKPIWRAYLNDPTRRATVAILGSLIAYGFLLSLKQGTMLRIPEMLMWMLIGVRVMLLEHEQIELWMAESAADDDDGDDLHAAEPWELEPPDTGPEPMPGLGAPATT